MIILPIRSIMHVANTKYNVANTNYNVANTNYNVANTNYNVANMKLEFWRRFDACKMSAKIHLREY